jgi:hypothetical protein
MSFTKSRQKFPLPGLGKGDNGGLSYLHCEKSNKTGQKKTTSLKKDFSGRKIVEEPLLVKQFLQ